jgi:2-hydroxychromene-2-carboxylate isomerase
MTETATGASSVSLECFFDCSSPWTYLAFHAVQPMTAALGMTIDWRPVLVGGIFNEVNRALYETRDNPPCLPKAAYSLKDMQDWARLYGLTIHFPPSCGHPVNAVKVMRACCAIQADSDRADRLVPFAAAAFETLWRDERDFAKEEVLADIARAAGVEPDWLLASITTPEIKAALRANTDEAIARGAFGSPTFFVDRDDMYFGNDRMPLLEAALKRSLGAG